MRRKGLRHARSRSQTLAYARPRADAYSNPGRWNPSRLLHCGGYINVRYNHSHYSVDLEHTVEESDRHSAGGRPMRAGKTFETRRDGVTGGRWECGRSNRLSFGPVAFSLSMM